MALDIVSKYLLSMFGNGFGMNVSCELELWIWDLVKVEILVLKERFSFCVVVFRVMCVMVDDIVVSRYWGGDFIV